MSLSSPAFLTHVLMPTERGGGWSGRLILMGAITTASLATALGTIGVWQLVRRYVRWWFCPLHHSLPSAPDNDKFWFGNFWAIHKEPFLEPHKRWMAQVLAKTGNDGKNPNTRAFYYTTILGRSNVLVLDKQIIKTVLTTPDAGKPQPRFIKKMALLQNIVGKGLVVLEGPAWQYHRRMLQPAFKTQSIRHALQEVVPAKVSVMIDAWRTAAGSEMDAHAHFSALTLDILGIAALEHEFHGLQVIQEWAQTQRSTATNSNKGSDAELKDIRDPFLLALMNAFKLDTFGVFASVLNLPILDRLRRRKRIVRKHLNEQTDKIISNAAQYKADVTSSGESPSTTRSSSSSLLSFMLQHQQQGPSGKLSLEELRDEVKTFMVAGHETTSTWCYWAVYALSKFPNIQKRVYENVIQYAPVSVETIGLEHTEQMECFHGFMQEVLRMYPPVGVFFRFTTRQEVFPGTTDGGGDVVLPPGTRIALSPHLLQRHPKYWDNPDSFDPERWIHVSSEESDRRRYAFFPFSLGGRNCIGEKFATMEAYLIMAALVRAFTFDIAPSQQDVEHTFTSSITMKTRPGLRIVVQSRGV